MLFEMSVPELIRLFSWFLPIPFMLLFFFRTKKLNKYTNLVFYCLVANVIALFFVNHDNLGFNFWLIQYYLMAIGIVFLIYRKQLDFPQALSLSFNTVYFNSFFWEIPIHIYTPIVRGYFDQALPLHLLYFFPFLFIWNVTKIPLNKKTLFLLALNFTVSTLLLFLLLSLNVNIWNVTAMPLNMQFITQTIWMLNRIISLTCLTTIIYWGIKN